MPLRTIPPAALAAILAAFVVAAPGAPARAADEAPPPVAAPQPASETPTQPPVELRVDATAVDRHLLTSEMVFPVTPGEHAFWYPEWIPGVSGATGQISNLAGVFFEDEHGQPLAWRRDAVRLNRFVVTVPPGQKRMRVRLTYLANQPNPLSVGVDAYGTRQLLAVSFNSCVLYPEATEASELPMRVRVRLPKGWGYGCSLAAGEEDDRGWIDFGNATLAELVDSPLVAGEHYRRLRFDSAGAPAATFHIVGDTPASCEVPRRRVEQLSRLVPEAMKLMGGAPFREYSFLVVCSDRLPKFGLEHLSCSLNCVRSMALVEDDLFGHRAAYLFPHELVHAWCGKQRLPAGMLSTNFHTPLDTELLWVYEGLTQYLMQLVAVRSGQVAVESHLEYLAHQVADQLRRAGREWRPLADTAVAAPTLRGGSPTWNDLRRGQDYYDEGALFWLEVDCLLRAKTEERVSLDDFCRAFFAQTEGRTGPHSYELDDVVATLDSLAPADWRGLIRERVYAPRPSLTLEGVHEAGYRLDWTDKKPRFERVRERVLGSVQAIDSLGVAISIEGDVQRVAPGSPADTANLRAGGRVIAVNRRSFSPATLDEELERGVEGDGGSELELIVQEGEFFHIHTLDYHDGPRYAVLVPRGDESPDRLAAILRPVAVSAPEPVRTAAKPKGRGPAS